MYILCFVYKAIKQFEKLRNHFEKLFFYVHAVMEKNDFLKIEFWSGKMWSAENSDLKFWSGKILALAFEKVLCGRFEDFWWPLQKCYAVVGMF